MQTESIFSTETSTTTTADRHSKQREGKFIQGSLFLFICIFISMIFSKVFLLYLCRHWKNIVRPLRLSRFHHLANFNRVEKVCVKRILFGLNQCSRRPAMNDCVCFFHLLFLISSHRMINLSFIHKSFLFSYLKVLSIDKIFLFVRNVRVCLEDSWNLYLPVLERKWKEKTNNRLELFLCLSLCFFHWKFSIKPVKIAEWCLSANEKSNWAMDFVEFSCLFVLVYWIWRRAFPHRLLLFFVSSAMPVFFLRLSVERKLVVYRCAFSWAMLVGKKKKEERIE